jgi:DNA-binding beta-propeller fold protein YncE
MTRSIPTSKARLALAALAVMSALVAVPAAANAAGGGRQPDPFSGAAIASRAPATRLDTAFARILRAASSPFEAGAQSALVVPISRFAGPFGSGSALVGSAPVGNGPSFTAVDPATHTLYVANGFNANGNADGGNTVSVIDERHCQADDVWRCKGPWPTLTVGSDPNADPSGVAIDQQTDTLYVAASNDNTVAVFNGATCNAETSAGCGQTPAMVPAGMAPVAIFEDPANHTVYIPNVTEDDVSMLDTATCNATDLAACPTTPAPTVPVPSNPVAGAVDASTHTVYVTVCGDPDFGCPAGINGVSVFDASTCNATVQSGCDELGTIPTAFPPVGDAQVDPWNQTLYMADGDNTISAFDLRSCNAADLAGCATDTPGTVTLPAASFAVALWVAVDSANHSVYVTNQKDDSVAVVNANVCNGRDLAGCATLDPPEIHTGADPEVLTLDPDTQTLYTANQDDNDVSVIAASRCDAQTTRGCRPRVPEVPNVSGALASDPAVHTTYVASSATAVAMIDDRTSNAFHTAGCAQAPPTVTVGAYPSAVADDPITHTVYVANSGAGASGTISVFDDRTCNATNQAGCGTVSTLNVPDGNPVGLAVNPVTDTLYAATLTNNGGPDLISVFNGSTCNATTTGGCGQTPANAATGPDGGAPFASTESVAVNAATNTVYATSDVLDANPFIGDSVYVINGTTCDAANTAGCPNPPATISVGSDPLFGDANPFGIAVNDATDTIYTANIFNGEGPGTVSVIDGATCNSLDTAGCGQTPATAPAGFGADGIAVDQWTNHVYATNIEDTSVTTINGNRCNGTNASGCDDTRTDAIVGDYPGSISVDPFVGSAYVADSEGVSVIRLTREPSRQSTTPAGTSMSSESRATSTSSRPERPSNRGDRFSAATFKS